MKYKIIRASRQDPTSPELQMKHTRECEAMEQVDGILPERRVDSEGEQPDYDLSQRGAYSTEQTTNASGCVEMDYFTSNDIYPTQSQSDTQSTESISEEDSQNAAQTSAAENEEPQEHEDESLHDSSEYDDDELAPLAYARRHGLITSYLHEQPFRAADPAPSPTVVCADLEDPESTLNISDIANVKELNGITVSEKWDVDKETATFLASLLALGKDDGPMHSRQNCGPLYLRDLRLEEPLLSSDPEVDVWRLKRRKTVAISSDGMRPFELKDEEGESFTWSTSELRAPAEKDELIANEKLDVDRETMEYLKDIMSLGCPADEENMNTDADQSAVCRLCPLANLFANSVQIRPPSPLTPPLLSMSPPLSPGGPSTAAMEIDFTSTPEDLSANEAARMERRILEHDDALSPNPLTLKPQYVNANMDPKSIFSPLRTPEDSSTSPSRRRRIQDLEADVPLIPQEPVELPPKKVKTVSFPAELHTTIRTPDVNVLTSDFEQDVDSFITEVVTPLAESAIRQAENEQLVEVDTTMRVVVPGIEDIELSPPWKRSNNKESTLASHKKLLSRMKTCLANSETKWSSVSKVERLLSWSPFPTRLGKVQLDETFDDGSLARYMDEVTFEDHVDVESLVWKPEGRRILDAEDSDDEELEARDSDEEDEPSQTPLPTVDAPGAPPQLPGAATFSTKPDAERRETRRMDMQTLLRKRKLELEGADDSKRPTKQLDQSRTDAKHDHDSITKPTISDAVDHGSGLLSFMHLHGGQAKIANMPKKQQVPSVQQFAPPAVMVEPENRRNEQIIPGSSLAVPDIKDAENQRAVVLSSDRGANRVLVRHILSALPTIDLVERDPITLPGKNSQATSKHGNRYEADITISPSTGLILTTLQKLKQKPLPGQSTFFGVRDRIQNVAVRYERVVVLVSEARQRLDGDSTLVGPLDETDTEALSDLIGFGAVLSTDIEVYYVSGGEPELAKWIAAFISRHSIPDVDTKLLHDETLWERFLRHAGLDGYAAQVILSELKRCEGSQIEGSSSTVNSITVPPHGLAAFVEMAADQRLERFGPLMGGNRVLRRVNDVIDSHWMSASTMKK